MKLSDFHSHNGCGGGQALFRVEARVLESGISVVATYGRLPLLQFVKLDLVKLATDLYLIIGAIQFPFSPLQRAEIDHLVEL